MGRDFQSFKIYDQPPWYMIVVWITGTILALSTSYLSIRSQMRHHRAAERAGFGFLQSHGARADRVIACLRLPLIFSILSCLQLFFPWLGGIYSFLRVIFLSQFLSRLVELFFMLAGGRDKINSNLPREPIHLYHAPPCCCCWCYPCCKKVVSKAEIGFMMIGVRMFEIGLPLAGLFDVTVNSFLYGKTGDPTVKSELTRAFKMILIIWGMWSLNCILQLQKYALTQNAPEYDTKAIQLFTTSHMFWPNLMELVVPLIITKGARVGNWQINRSNLTNIILGFAICVLELLLASSGDKAYPSSEVMYPPPDCAGGLPLDTIPLLQLNGVHASKWDVLRNVSPNGEPNVDLPLSVVESFAPESLAMLAW